jgi:membrane-bound lytic murein transglycosylase B
MRRVKQKNMKQKNIKQKATGAWIFFMLSMLLSSAHGSDYLQHAEMTKFIDRMVDEHQFNRGELVQQFSEVKKKQKIIDAMSGAAERTKTWGEYRNIFIKDRRIEQGVKFWLENAETLARAESVFGVPAEIVVSIIGVETNYGSNKGSWRVMDALSTLAFDYPLQDDAAYTMKRKKFFASELENFLLLAREQKQNPLELKGSYAGAMGYGQFMPSSYRRYATDFDGDGFIDIWENQQDAIGSVANYFVEHGWLRDQAITTRARLATKYDKEIINLSRKERRKRNMQLDDIQAKGFSPVASLDGQQHASVIKLQGEKGAEFWLGFNNFYVITRYNTSIKYAMAVFQLSQAIEQAMHVEIKQ